jgi:hypothetical protein
MAISTVKNIGIKVIDEKFAKRFVASWIAAWNSHDIENIFAHYEDDFEMNSPLIVERMELADGTLKGKHNIRPYWEIGLASTPPLKFELISYFIGVNSIVILYKSVSRKRVSEVLIFSNNGLVCKGISHHAN